MTEFDDPEAFVEQEFKAEFGVFERVGFSRVMGTDIEGVGQLAKAQKRIILDKTGDDKFILSLELYFNLLKKEYKTEISGDIQDFIQYKGTMYPKTGHLNAFGLILGYIITNGGKNINLNELNRWIKIVKGTGQLSEILSTPDLIKYSRFWLNNS